MFNQEITAVWPEKFEKMIPNLVEFEAAKRFRTLQVPDSLKSWEQLKKELRQKFWNKAGVSVDSKLDLDFEVHKTIQMKGYSIQCITYQSSKGVYVTANLFIPAGKGPFPAVINVHGHWLQGKIAEAVQARGHSLASHGFVCLSIDAFGAGERSTVHGEYEYHGSHIGFPLLNLGETLLGHQLVDNMRGVDLLETLDFVDSNNIGVTGASGGGNQTMWLAAMDERIKAATPVVSVGTFESHLSYESCICEVMPDVLDFSETSHVLAMVAPRAIKMCNGIKDPSKIFYPTQMMRSYAQARKVFQYYDKDSSLSYQIFNHPHGYFKEIREAMLGWMNRWLKNEGTGEAIKEKLFDVLPEEELLCFEKGKRSDKVKSLFSYIYTKSKQVVEQNPVRVDLNMLKETLRYKDVKIKQSFGHGDIRGESGIKKASIELENQKLLPLVYKLDSTKVLNVYLDLDGKEKAWNAESFQKEKNSNSSFVLFDFSGTGEVANVEANGSHHEYSRWSMLLGKRLLGEWVSELQAVIAFLQSKCNFEEVRICARRETCLIALYYANIYSVKSLVLDELISSFINEDKPSFSFSIHTLGQLQYGDVDFLCAASKAEISLSKPLHFNGKEMNSDEVEAFQKRISEISDKL